MFKTRVTEMLGIEHPIIQGAMQWLSRAEMVSAVSNAGGLGVISSLSFPAVKELQQEIEELTAELKKDNLSPKESEKHASTAAELWQRMTKWFKKK